jgi:hypothetical protein
MTKTQVEVITSVQRRQSWYQAREERTMRRAIPFSRRGRCDDVTVVALIAVFVPPRRFSRRQPRCYLRSLHACSGLFSFRRTPPARRPSRYSCRHDGSRGGSLVVTCGPCMPALACSRSGARRRRGDHQDYEQIRRKARFGGRIHRFNSSVHRLMDCS